VSTTSWPATVIAFDAHVGLGTVRLDDGREIPFHCAEIADGSRRIEVGESVSCEVRQKFGRPEAFHLVGS
jgi:cold shock CspA family protein